MTKQKKKTKCRCLESNWTPESSDTQVTPHEKYGVSHLLTFYVLGHMRLPLGGITSFCEIPERLSGLKKCHRSLHPGEVRLKKNVVKSEVEARNLKSFPRFHFDLCAASKALLISRVSGWLVQYVATFC